MTSCDVTETLATHGSRVLASQAGVEPAFASITLLDVRSVGGYCENWSSCSDLHRDRALIWGYTAYKAVCAALHHRTALASRTGI